MTPGARSSILGRVESERTRPARWLGTGRRSRLGTLAVLVALVAILAGCGGGPGGGMMGGSGSMMKGGRQGMMAGAATPTATVPGAAAGNGRALFVAAGCGGCHTLADAGTSGDAGPNLDQARPSYDLVVRRVSGGGGGMPPFGGSLTSAQIEAIARYVSSASRR